MVIFLKNDIKIIIEKETLFYYKHNELKIYIRLSDIKDNKFTHIDNTFIYLISYRYLSITFKQENNYKIIIYDLLLEKQHLGIIVNKKYDSIDELYNIYSNIKRLLKIKNNEKENLRNFK